MRKRPLITCCSAYLQSKGIAARFQRGGNNKAVIPGKAVPLTDIEAVWMVTNDIISTLHIATSEVMSFRVSETENASRLMLRWRFGKHLRGDRW